MRPRGQGEDIVSGRVRPEPLSALAEQMPMADDVLYGGVVAGEGLR